MFPKTRLAALLLLGLTSVAAARTDQGAGDWAGSISGRVYDVASSEPVAYVSVYLDSLFIGGATDPDGRFAIQDIPPGRYRLVARRVGYAPHLEEVRISPGCSIFRSIGLRRAQVQAQELVVTAARREQTAQMVPASVAVVKASDLESRAVTTFDQVLDAVPGISTCRSAGTSVQSVSIRGSSTVAGGGVGNRVLLMIDGRPALASDSGGALWSLVPTGCIERVEIVKGPFSSLYGSTAMGGVINVITRRPTLITTTSLELTYGFFEQPHPDIRYTRRTPLQTQALLTRSGQRGPLGYFVHLSRKQSDGHSENGAYEFWSVFGKLLYELGWNRSLELVLASSVSENDYPHTWESALQPLRVRPEYRDDRQKKRDYSADLTYHALVGTRGRVFSRWYLYRKAARSSFNESDPSVTSGTQAYGLRLVTDADKLGSITQLDYRLSPRNYLISGLDIQIDRVHSSPDTLMFGDHQVNNFAVFLQDETGLSASLTTTLGIRYDWNHLAGGSTQGQLSPKWAIVYRPRSNLAFRALMGQAFRAPSIIERFIRQELGGGVRFVTPRSLKPERMDLSLEAGARWDWADWATVDVAYFRHHYQDLIYWVAACAPDLSQPCTLFRIDNLSRALMQGAELGLDLRWNALGLGLYYTYLDAEDRSPGREDDLLAYRVRHSVRWSVRLGLRRLTLGLDGRYRSKTEEVFLYPEKPDAFFVTNAKASLRVKGPLHVSVAVNNVFDTTYEELARYRMPGRNWIFGATWGL